MKTYSVCCVLAIGAFLLGCASEGNRLVLDPVGPSFPQIAEGNSRNGTLVVYSAYDASANWTARNPRRPVYSNYKILSEEGKFLQFVHNDTGTILQDPVQVELPAGTYRVVAQANGYINNVIVPVVIVSNQVTIIHLEGGGVWPNEAEFNQTNAVRLPNGIIVGWRSLAN